MQKRVGIASLMLLVASCGSPPPEDETSSGESVADQLAFSDDSKPTTEAEPTQDDAVTIGVVNLTSIAALDLLYEGFEEGIEACPTSDAVIDYRNAAGDGELLRPYVDEMLADEVDLILAITTPALQAATAANLEDGGETPVLFGAVTDPYTAGVATDRTDKPTWMTGWRTNADVEPLFELAAEVRDPVERIGVVYNPDQVNSTIDVGKMQAVADGLGIELLISPVADRDGVSEAAQDLAADGVEVFLVPNDIVVVDGLADMAAVADEFDIPVISLAPDSVYDGAAVGIGLDYRGDGGRLAADACDILDGSTTAAELPIRSQREQLVFYSPAAAEAQGFNIPDQLVETGFDVDGAGSTVGETG